ncbi:MAG: hypothetical protein LAO22_02890 [Acidobacteriia bacterium]|nr:hypothetical protein [Terriglobia bacterium]
MYYREVQPDQHRNVVGPHAQEIHDVGIQRSKILQGVQERFKAGYQTDAQRDANYKIPHFEAQKAVPQENECEQSALQDIERLVNRVSGNDHLAKTPGIHRSYENQSEQSENGCGAPEHSSYGLAQWRAARNRCL